MTTDSYLDHTMIFANGLWSAKIGGVVVTSPRKRDIIEKIKKYDDWLRQRRALGPKPLTPQEAAPEPEPEPEPAPEPPFRMKP